MDINLTNESSAKLLGLPLACYTAEYQAAALAVDTASKAMERIDDESSDYPAAHKRYVEAYRAWDELNFELSGGQVVS